jgi:glycosyltransferase involved in cell wall biosynthesis
MKVAYLLGSLNRGGTETLLLDVFNQSDNSPYEMVGVYRKEGELSDSFRASKVKIYKVEQGKNWMVLVFLWRLRKLFKLENPDIIHAQQSIDAIFARIACIGLQVKVIQTVHGYDFEKKKLFGFVIRMSLLLTNRNIFVSKTQRNYYELSYNQIEHIKNSVVYNGVNFDKFNTTEEKLRDELGLNNNLLMGMVGNFVKVREQMTVCRFLDLLNKREIDFTFLFIGRRDNNNPELYDDCQLFCKKNGLGDKVKFVGSRPDVPAILPQLDAFIYSTDHDTFGLAVVEAIASGIPVFVNDLEVMKEITENGKQANLYRTKNEFDLLDKFLLFLEQQEIFKKAALENAKWIRKTYSIQKHIFRLFDVYRGLV